MIKTELAELERVTYDLKHFSARAHCHTVAEEGLVIELDGNFDGEAANTVMPVILSLISQWEGSPRVIIDAHGLEYISSLGIGVLTMARAVARQRGIALVLGDPQPAVLRVLELLGMTGYMSIQNTP